jgi:competence protein ComEA
MLKARLFIASFSAVLALSSSAGAQAPDLPEGRGKEQVMNACASCHEIARVTAQRRSKAQWHETVDDMIARGAQVADADYDDVIAYLSTHFSTSAEKVAARP